MATVGEESRDPSHTSQQARVENTPPALTRTSGRGFPETHLGGAQRTVVRAAPDAPEERERRELEASTFSEPCVHAQTNKHTYTRAHIHALFYNRGRETADAE